MIGFGSHAPARFVIRAPVALGSPGSAALAPADASAVGCSALFAGFCRGSLPPDLLPEAYQLAIQPKI